MHATFIGMATVILEVGGSRFITDPVLDPKGTAYSLGKSGVVRYINEEGPAVSPDTMPDVDYALLSHDQHKDNLDRAGRELLKKLELTLTTNIGEKRLGKRHGISVKGLAPWQSHSITLKDGTSMKITATPARHGPPVVAKLLAGDVIGFIMESEHFDSGAVYITGDTRFYKGVQQVADRFDVGTVIVNLGAGKFSATGPICYSMGADEGVKTAKLFNKATIVPMHFEGWSHLSEGRKEVEMTFAKQGLQDRLQWMPLGEETRLRV